MNFKMSFLKNLIFVIPYLLLVFFLGYLPWTYSHNIEKLIQFPHYSWILLVATVVFLLTSFIENNAITRLLVPFTKIKIKYWGGLYIVLLALFVGVTIYKESYRDSMFLIFSIVVSCFSAMIAALYGGLINKKKIIKGLAIISAFLISILVWIAESYSSYYSGVEIGAIQAATLYQNTVKSIILTNPEAEVQEKKILEFSKNVSGASIETVVYKNGKVFIKPVTNKRPGYILSENAKLMKFDDSFGNKYQVYYQFYNRPELTSGLKSDNWGGLTKAVIFSANEAYEADTDSKGNVKRDDKGNIIFKDNTYFFKKESYLRSLNLWWMFWLMYGLFIYGFYHYHEKVGALDARDKAFAEVRIANKKQEEALEESRIANQKQREALEQARIANQKQKEALLDRDKALENERIANQRQKEALEEARIANRKQQKAYADLEIASQAKSLAIKEKDEALSDLNNFRLTYDKIRGDFAARTSDSKNNLQVVNSTYDKQAWDVQEKAAAKLGRHDIFGAFQKFRKWKKEQFEEAAADNRQITLNTYRGNVKQYFELLHAIGEEYGENLISDTYDITLSPWLKVMQNELRELEHVLDITPETKTVKQVLEAMVSGKAIPKNLADNKLEGKRFKKSVSVTESVQNKGKCQNIVLSKLQSIIFNLIENSARAIDEHFERLDFEEKFGYEGIIELRISETMHKFKNDEACQALCFEVQDNAGGFPDSILKDIYKRAVPSTRVAGRDYGEGTVYIGFFVDLMKGDIEAQNADFDNYGRGALTKVYIPYSETEA